MAATIQSLERGLLILNIIGKAGKPLLLNDIAEHFTIDRSSVFRLVSTLVKTGFVIQNAETKQYSLGYRVLELSGAFSNASYIESLIRPVMKRLLAKTNQNTHLAVLDGKEVIFIAVEQPKDHLSLNISVGTREPSTVTALGKSLLAYTAPDELKRILPTTKLKKYTKKSVGSISELKKDLKKIQSLRLAMDDEEYRTGIVCFAAPVFDHNGKAIYSLGISGLRDALKPRAKEFAEIVKQAGIDASALLGHGPDCT